MAVPPAQGPNAICLSGEVVAALRGPEALRRVDRRSFLAAAAGFGVTAGMLKAEKRSEAAYRFMTAEGEVRMSVQYFANPEVDSFRFRDGFSNRVFCLSGSGQENTNCLERFVGSMAIASYRFRDRGPAPLNLRERVVTIDQDERMSPRPPFEGALRVERDVASDIQAFGYDPDHGDTKPVAAVWRLLRQDLYLNDRDFLIVHWKHTLDLISLLDVIPGDGTRVLG